MALSSGERCRSIATAGCGGRSSFSAFRLEAIASRLEAAVVSLLLYIGYQLRS